MKTRIFCGKYGKVYKGRGIGGHQGRNGGIPCSHLHQKVSVRRGMALAAEWTKEEKALPQGVSPGIKKGSSIPTSGWFPEVEKHIQALLSKRAEIKDRIAAVEVELSALRGISDRIEVVIGKMRE